jgi:hypothetical protein
MPRKINLLAVAAGKLVLAIQKEAGEVNNGSDAAVASTVRSRAQSLQHAAHNDCVAALLDGRSVAAYLDAAWVETHPAIKPSVEAFASQVKASRFSAKERL